MARLDLEPSCVVVTLSRRNLLALLHKVDWPGSARTIVNNDCYWNGLPIDGLTLVLRVEDDDEHYRRRAEPPGHMHPRTEVFILDHRSCQGRGRHRSAGDAP